MYICIYFYYRDRDVKSITGTGTGTGSAGAPQSANDIIMERRRAKAIKVVLLGVLKL